MKFLIVLERDMYSICHVREVMVFVYHLMLRHRKFIQQPLRIKSFLSHKSVQITCFRMSDQLLYAWGRDFVVHVLTETPWDKQWKFEFQMPDSKDPYVVFYIGSTRSTALRGFEKGYHGCPLSVAQGILRKGFIIGKTLGLWYCERGLFGYGRWHALQRSTWQRGHLEHGALCLWTQAVAVGFVVRTEVCGTGGHEPVGFGTTTLTPVKRIVALPGRGKFKKGETLSLNHDPFRENSVELHVNLRHYLNFQIWDRYLVQYQLVFSFHAGNVVKDLRNGILILSH